MSCFYNFRAIHYKLFSDFSKFFFPSKVQMHPPEFIHSNNLINLNLKQKKPSPTY